MIVKAKKQSRKKETSVVDLTSLKGSDAVDFLNAIAELRQWATQNKIVLQIKTNRNLG